MKHFKSRSIQCGQTFMEVVLAVFMVGALLSAILTLQNSVFNRVATSAGRLRRLIVLDTFLQDQKLALRLQEKEQTTLDNKNPETKILSHTKQLAQGSALSSFKNISLFVIEATWKHQEKPYKELVPVILYKQPQGQKK